MRFSNTRYLLLLLFCLCFFTASAAAQTGRNSLSANFGDPRIVNQSLQQGDSVAFFEISPNEQWLVYRLARSDSRGNFVGSALFSVPLSGGTPRQISVPAQTNSSVGRWQISPDSRFVVYTFSDPTFFNGNPRGNNLYAVPIGGGDSIQLNRRNRENVFIDRFKISPDGGRIVYRADEVIFERFDLYSVPIQGGDVAQISGALTVGGDVQISYQFDPSGQYVVYVADQNKDRKLEIFRTGVTAANVVQLNPDIPDDADVSSSFQLSEKTGRVVFRISYAVSDGFESALFSRRLADPDLVELRPRSSSSLTYFLTPSDRVVYTDTGLQSIGIDGTGSFTIATPDNFSVSRTDFSSDGNSMLVRARATPTGRQNSVYEITVDRRTPPRRLSCPTTSQEEVNLMEYTPDDTKMVCSTDDGSFNLTGLYVTSLMTNTARPLIQFPLNDQTRLDQLFQISPDSQRVVFSYGDDVVGGGTRNVDLYSSDLSTGQQVKVNLERADGRSVGIFEMTPSGQNLVFAARDANAPFQLFIARLVDDELCWPIKAANEKVAVVCL